jgi:HSP20 family protein
MSEKKEGSGKGERLPAKSGWDPFGDFELFEPWSTQGGRRSRLARLLEGVFSDLPASQRLAPAVDVHEDEKHYTITVELPGCAKSDVTVEVNEGVLTLRGEKKSEREEKKEQRRWVERSFGSFARSFTLPGDAASDRIQAAFENGVLTVTIPRTGESKPQIIAVK